MIKKAFGSGYFGEWIEDEFALPAYRYICDQINDPKAISPVNEIWRIKTEHLHEVGNDRLVGIASNYGHIQVRQDEGGPKFLNDYNPKNYQYAGGFGYLTDGKDFISTYYPGNSEIFERIFGMGYFRKKVAGNGLSVDQIIFAPFGNDPLLISQVIIRNERNEPVNLRWIEYWGCQIYQLSYKAFMMGLISKTPIPEIRRKFNKKFEQKFSKINENAGILVNYNFKGFSTGEKMKWALFNFILATLGKKYSGGAVKRPVKEANLDDLSPPSIFLISLDMAADGFSLNASEFFGKGGVESPDGLNNSLKLDITQELPESEKGIFIERQASLEPGQYKTLYFAYGYLPEGMDLQLLIEKYKENPEALLAQSCEKWKKDRIEFVLNEEPWVDRELQWHNYYLRGNLTYDSFFKEHILSQGHVYQYIIGFQGASRDPCQHALPFIYSDPDIVKEIIRYTLKTVQPDGLIPYGIVGNGTLMPAPFKPSDLEMWLLWLASEYVLSSRDLSFLEERIPTYPVYGSKSKPVKVIDILIRCYNHFISKIGTGKHGLQRLSNGDWNDMVILGYVPNKKHKKVKKIAESVLNAAMATYSLDIFSRLLSYSGREKFAKDVMIKTEEQRKAVSSQWAGKWFKRAWLTEELGWVGEKELWLEPQPWAIIGEVATLEQKEKLVEVINKELRQPSKIGAMIINKSVEKSSESPGMGTNAGIWYSINGTLIWALSLVDGNLAWDEWKKNTLAFHAEAYPDIWYGIWSGPDVYNSELSKYPGQTVFEDKERTKDSKKSNGLKIKIFWTDFPVMNMHSHAWPLYTISKLIGIEFTSDGVKFKPTIPKDEYKFSSPLIGFEKSKEGYSGWYAPKVAGTWKFTLKLDDIELNLIENVEINGKEEEPIREDGAISWSGESKPERPLKWIIKKSTIS